MKRNAGLTRDLALPALLLLLFAVALYGPEIEALQLVHADDAGRWPWSVDFRDGAGGQPVLGERHHG